jgi:hypothetical protein
MTFTYISQQQFLFPYRKPPHSNLTPHQEYVNSIISHYHARIEHINHLFEQHGIFRGTFRGGVALLSDAFYVIAHTTNMVLRAENRYPGFGPWSHNLEL